MASRARHVLCQLAPILTPTLTLTPSPTPTPTRTLTPTPTHTLTPNQVTALANDTVGTMETAAYKDGAAAVGLTL